MLKKSKPHSLIERWGFVVSPLEERTILFVGGQNVLPDADLAKLYSVATERLNQQVSRNRGRFPVDFMFALTKKEVNDLRCHFGTSSWGGTRYAPMAFTEQGVAMLSGVPQISKSSLGQH